jgi:hypothetical protein
MRRIVVAVAIAVVLLLVAAQLAVPRIVERKVASRIAEGGGHADVSISAFPAVRLLWGEGGSFEAAGRDLRFDLERGRQDVFERLDGFGRVDIRFTALTAGPLQVQRFRLTRDGDGPYRLRLAGATSPRALAREAAARSGVPLGGLIGSLGAGMFGDGGRAQVPLALDAEITSRDGRPAVNAASGSVSGVPAGPLSEIVVRAVLERL